VEISKKTVLALKIEKVLSKQILWSPSSKVLVLENKLALGETNTAKGYKKVKT
jgi:hypothetical protein